MTVRIERVYEDNVSDKLSDDCFPKMSRRYEKEQKKISERIKTLRTEIDKLSSNSGYVHFHRSKIHNGKDVNVSYAE